jgi:hypothetical protein
LPPPPFTYPQYQLDDKKSLREKARRKMKQLFQEIKCWGFLKMFNPLHAGFIPYIEKGSAWYIPLQMHTAEVSQAEGVTVVKTSGTLASVSRQGVLPLLLFACNTFGIFNSLPIKKKRQMMVRNSNMFFDRRIVIDDTFLYFQDRLWGDKIGDVFFNFRAYNDYHFTQENKQLKFSKESCGFIILLDEGETVVKCATLGSSKGLADYWRVTVGRKPSLVNSKQTITLRHTILPYNSDNTIEQSLDLYKARLSELAEKLQ